MAYTNYTIIPVDTLVIVDGEAATGVSMTGIPADVSVIQWYGASSAGTIEYLPDSSGVIPAPGSFTDPTDYSTQVTEAEAIIYARNHPVAYYSTINGNVYNGVTYNLGDPIVIYTPATPQPANTTTAVPGTPAAYQTLYYYGGSWVISSVDPSQSLSDAKASLNKEISISAATCGNYQARLYSTYQLLTSGSLGTLPTADYSGYTLSSYQTYLDGEVSTMQTAVNGATTVPDLYTFDPTVNPTP